MIYGIVFIIILTGGMLAFVENDKARNLAFLTYLALAVPVLLLFAASRAIGVDGDSPMYLDWYNNIVNGQLGDSLFARDPAFVFVTFAVSGIGLPFAFLLAIYSSTCMVAQFFFLKAAIATRWLPLGFFLVLCRYFIPHEMTQIRAAVAIPLLSIAILQFARRRFLAGWILYCTALVFHASTLITLPMVCAILFGARFESRSWLRWIAVAGIVVHFVFERFSAYLIVFDRLSDYVNGVQDVTANSLLSVYFLLRLALLLFVYIFLWKNLDRTERIMVLCSALGLSLEAALSSNSNFAVRSAELFGMFDMATAILVFRHIRPRAIPAYALLLLVIGGNFYRSSLKIVEDYRSVLFAEGTQAPCETLPLSAIASSLLISIKPLTAPRRCTLKGA